MCVCVCVGVGGGRVGAWGECVSEISFDVEKTGSKFENKFWFKNYRNFVIWFKSLNIYLN